MSEYPEYDLLLSKYLEGSIQAEELSRLEAKLLADDVFARHVSRWCLVHRQVSELLTENTLHQLMDQFSQGSPSLPVAAVAQLNGQDHTQSTAPWSLTNRGRLVSNDRLGGSRIRPLNRRRWIIWIASLAALLLIALAWYTTHLQSLPPGLTAEDANAIRRQNGENVDVVATLTQVVDGVWVKNAAALRTGQLLGKGSRVALQSGMAKVTFECGAEIVLQGPCDFEVKDQMVGVLKAGKITANVPHRAFSFAILSPQVDFVDLGTAFGVSVGASGKTELHVFEGEVLCSPSKPDAAEHKEPIHVTAANALAFDSKSGDPSNIAMNKEQFSPLIDLRRAASGHPAGLIGDHLALWLSAGLGVATDERGRVVSWQDILYGDNRSAEDATQNDEQARPTLVAEAINGHPAVRFNGESNYLVTTPLETTDNQTVLFVCQYSPSAFNKNRKWGGQILNYDGPPSREAYGYLSNTLQPGVLQIGEPLLAEEFKPTLLTGQVFAGFVGMPRSNRAALTPIKSGPKCRSSRPMCTTTPTGGQRFRSTGSCAARHGHSLRKASLRGKSSAGTLGSSYSLAAI